MMNRVSLWLRSVLLRRRLEREMQAEMAEHIERSTDRIQARGMSRKAARREALREFGNVGYLQEEGRLARGTGWLDTLIGDIRFAFRHFARNPFSTVTIIAVLSIGIGINVLLYTIVQSYTARPPVGIEASDDLVRIRGSRRGTSGRAERAFTLQEIESYAALDRHFTSVVGWTSQSVTAVSAGVEEVTVTATFVTDGYFPGLRVQPIFGRGLSIDGDEAQTVVLSHDLWTRLFAEAPNILGRTITVNEVPFTIVGVAPRGFYGALREGPAPPIWLPLSSYPSISSASDDAELFRAIGRLAPGVSREEASAAVAVIAGVTEQDTPTAGNDLSADVAPLLAANYDPGNDSQVVLIRGIFGTLGLLVLLVTCLNTSALQTGLALARRREIAIRTSLGATRRRVIRQLVTECIVLAAVAGVAAIGVTYAITRILMVLVVEMPINLSVDRSTLLFTFTLAIAAGTLFGVSPALHATRESVAGELKDTATSVAGAGGRLQSGLVVAQIALTQPLAVCVALFVSLAVYEFRDSPRNPYGDRIVSLRLASARPFDIDSALDSATILAERVETERLVHALQEVRGVGAVVREPGSILFNYGPFTFSRATQDKQSADERFYLVGRTAMPGYLDLMGRRRLLGRDLQPADSTAHESGVLPTVIGDDMARALWGDSNPIGQRVEQVSTTSERFMLEIVGVYEEPSDATGTRRSAFMVFVPMRHLPSNRSFWLRTTEPAEQMMGEIRGVARETVPRAAITALRTVRSMEDEERFMLWGATTLISTGGIIALLLAALGLYAVVSFAVGKRMSEIAVRVALGAQPRQIVRHIARDGLRLSLLGIFIGLPLSILALRTIINASPDVPEVSLSAVTAIVAVGVTLVAAIATWLPASRAARVDPAVTLRRE
jgi:predicted permease